MKTRLTRYKFWMRIELFQGHGMELQRFGALRVSNVLPLLEDIHMQQQYSLCKIGLLLLDLRMERYGYGIQITNKNYNGMLTRI